MAIQDVSADVALTPQNHMLSVQLYSVGNNERQEIQEIQIIIQEWVSPNSLNVGRFQDWLKDLIQSLEFFPALKPPMLIDVAL